jgi:uncharacterized protein YegL
MTSLTSENNTTPESKMTSDVIIILDQSGSMSTMGEEPIQSAKEFFLDQKKSGCGGTFTFVTFNYKSTVVFDEVPFSEMNTKMFPTLSPRGTTSLNDAVCQTIQNKFL